MIKEVFCLYWEICSGLILVIFARMQLKPHLNYRSDFNLVALLLAKNLSWFGTYFVSRPLLEPKKIRWKPRNGTSEEGRRIFDWACESVEYTNSGSHIITYDWYHSSHTWYLTIGVYNIFILHWKMSDVFSRITRVVTIPSLP